MAECVRDDEPRVVVHERCQVNPLVASQKEREDVRLPELIRTRSLEPAFGMLSLLDRGRRRDEALFVKNPPDLCLTHAERLEARQEVTDAARPVLRVLLANAHDCCTLGLLRRRPLANRHDRWLRLQRVDATAPVRFDPVQDCRSTRSEDPTQPLERHFAFEHLCHHTHPQHHRIRPARRPFDVAPVALPPSSLLLHLRLPFLASAYGEKGGRC